MENGVHNSPDEARLSISRRLVLWVGFGGLLVLMVLMAFHAGQALRQIEASNAKIREDYRRRDNLLDQLRFDLYKSGAEIRDFLLDPDPHRALVRRNELETTRTRMNLALGQYQRGIPPQESAAFEELQRDLSGYWIAMEPVFPWDSQTRLLLGRAFLRDVALPRYQQLMLLADRIAAMNERQLAAGESSVAKVFADFRRRLTTSALLAIGMGSALAVLSTRRILELERVSDQRYRDVVQAREEQQRLSARLVAAQEEERRRLSRELHDEVGQSMSTLLVELGTLEASLATENHGIEERFAAVRCLAEGAVGAIRNMALLLRPSMLDDLGLDPALRWQAREVSRRTGITIKVAAEGVSDDLPDEYRTCIYRVVQESLHNAARHAKARVVRVVVRQEPGQIRVAIQDDGAGFDSRQNKGMGIMGMEERIRALGGVFRIDSQPGSGTMVSILLPLAQPLPGRTL